MPFSSGMASPATELCEDHQCVAAGQLLAAFLVGIYAHELLEYCGIGGVVLAELFSGDKVSVIVQCLRHLQYLLVLYAGEVVRSIGGILPVVHRSPVVAST